MVVVYEFGINYIMTKIAGVIFSVTHCLHMCLAQKKKQITVKLYVFMIAVHGALVKYRGLIVNGMLYYVKETYCLCYELSSHVKKHAL